MDKVGAKLRDARVARGMSIEDIAQQTRVPRAAIVALETGDADALPAAVFVRGFVRSIAQALGIDGAPLVRELEQRQREAELGHAGTQRREARRARPATDEAPILPLAGSTRHMARGSAMRGGYLVLLLVAVGLLVAAWLMVGGKHAGQLQPTTTADPNVPAIQERVDGVSSIADTVDGTTRLR